MGPQLWRRQRRGPAPELVRFGEKGTKLVYYQGEVPREHRGVGTGRLYVFIESKRRQIVDARDLPCLAEDFGREQLVDPVTDEAIIKEPANDDVEVQEEEELEPEGPEGPEPVGETEGEADHEPENIDG